MTNEERVLLERLAAGELDGPVGDIREYGVHKTVYCGKYIRDGVPVSYRQGESERFFNGKENETIPGKRTEETYESDEQKFVRGKMNLPSRGKDFFHCTVSRFFTAQ